MNASLERLLDASTEQIQRANQMLSDTVKDGHATNKPSHEITATFRFWQGVRSEAEKTRDRIVEELIDIQAQEAGLPR